MTTLRQGAESAAIVAHWIERQPEAFRVVRDSTGAVTGFAVLLALHEATEEDLERDPGARAMWEYAQRHGAPRPGEQVFAARDDVDREVHQARR